ncbi:germination protease [Lachnospiraceae bacterium]|jgi:spore protease|nr:GPR endopeptidase [Lachnospiraceae bacterium]GFI16135.1 germination protease [Lachnospiraceae bacterium]GFI68429.1 germination protease [Lachnospiraceae bacterium]
MNSFKVRTDLALEARESMGENAKECRGVWVEEEYKEESELKITRVVIETMNGAKAMGKPVGTYITLEAPAMALPDEDYHQEISSELTVQLKEIIPEMDKELSILVVGLGNRDVTADALGPNVVDNLTITRHMVKEYGKAAYNRKRVHMVSGLIPGVMAKTGMESQEIIKGVVEKTKPDVVVVVDALAARSTKRLNRTIQITNTGIHPGSGVGNHRNAITQEALGVPVIAIGVPTVVDAATIVSDAFEKMMRQAGEEPIDIQDELMAGLGELYSMYVTGKDVDYEIKQISHIICNALNCALEV